MAGGFVALWPLAVLDGMALRPEQLKETAVVLHLYGVRKRSREAERSHQGRGGRRCVSLWSMMSCPFSKQWTEKNQDRVVGSSGNDVCPVHRVLLNGLSFPSFAYEIIVTCLPLSHVLGLQNWEFVTYHKLSYFLFFKNVLVCKNLKSRDCYCGEETRGGWEGDRAREQSHWSAGWMQLCNPSHSTAAGTPCSCSPLLPPSLNLEEAEFRFWARIEFIALPCIAHN